MSTDRYPNIKRLGQKLIDALHKGRKKYPEKKRGQMFSPDNPKAACALGAIAAGLGYNPDHQKWGNSFAYDFLHKQGLASSECMRLYFENDLTPDGEDPDEQVIKIIQEIMES